MTLHKEYKVYNLTGPKFFKYADTHRSGGIINLEDISIPLAYFVGLVLVSFIALLVG